jgi:hypothetical protein
MIIAANKSSKEVIDDEQESFYEERFLFNAEVNWDTHTAQDYFKLLKLFSDSDVLFFVSKLFEDNMLTLTTHLLRESP